MMSITIYPMATDASRKLVDLVNFLQKLDFHEDQVELGKLSDQATALKGRSAALSQLQELADELRLSSNALKGLMDTDTAIHQTDSNEPRLQDLKVALEKEASLNRTIDETIYSGTSGKDCRAAEMLIK